MNKQGTFLNNEIKGKMDHEIQRGDHCKRGRPLKYEREQIASKCRSIGL